MLKKTYFCIIILFLISVTFLFYSISFTQSANADTANWTTKDDFENNASTASTPTIRNNVDVADEGYVRLTKWAATAISGGNENSLVLLSNGTVYAFGYNYYGQLGNESSAMFSNTPVKVKGINNATAIANGSYHALALLSDGTVWSWGNNDNGQLGNGTSGFGYSSNVPVRVLNINNAVAIACGSNHSLALLSDGSVWAWGYNFKGQLGNESNTSSNIPVQVKGPNGIGNLSEVDAIAGGGENSMALLSDGTVWSWGCNLYGQLGDGSSIANVNTPVQVLGVGGAGYMTGVKAVACGFNHALALLSSGNVAAWGDNHRGQLGDGGVATSSNVPYLVISLGGTRFLSGITNISAGNLDSLAIDSDNTVWAWGLNIYGELGNNSHSDSDVPVHVLDEEGTGYLQPVKAIACGFQHSLAIKDGSVKSWGDGGYGELGDGRNGIGYHSNLPEQVNQIDGGYHSGYTRYLLINAGNHFTGNWSDITWNGITPPSTSLKIRTRGSSTQETLALEPWSDYYSSSGSVITTLDSQWLEIEVSLNTADGLDTPIFNDLAINYERGSTNIAPAFSSIGNRNVNEGDDLNFTVNATDFEGDPLTFSAAGLPAGAGFNTTTGVFNWTPGYDQEGTYSLHFEVSDGVGGTDFEDMTITVNDINRPPSLSDISDQNGIDGRLMTFDLNGDDPDLATDPSDDIRYVVSAYTFNDQPPVIGPPSGVSLTPAGPTTSTNCIVSWTPTRDQIGIYDVFFKVIDNDHEETTKVAHITISRNNRPPDIDTGDLGHPITDELNNLSFHISASDPDEDSLIYSATGLPNGAILDSITGEFNWTPGYNQNGDYKVTFQVSDGHLTDSENVTITVNEEGSASVSTPTGTNVPVDLGSKRKLIFNEISDPGTSSVTIGSVSPHPSPAGYRFVGKNYDVSTTATFLGKIKVTFPYDPAVVTRGENNLRLFHWENGSWRDVTVSVDTANKTITGEVSSLSPFAIGELGGGLSNPITAGYSIYWSIFTVTILTMTGGYLLKEKRAFI